MLAVRLSKEMENKLDALSKKTHRSKSYYVKKALSNFLDEQAEYLEALEAYEAYLKSGKKGYTFEEMKKRYGFE